MQRRQVGNASPSSGDGVARRSLMNPFAVQSTPFQSSNQQSSTYLQYPGMAAPTTSLRRQQEQQSESQHVLGRFWQPAATTEPPAYGRHGQQPRHGGSFDLGFNDMLDTPGGSSGGRSRSETTESQEISMTGFDLNSFHDGATNSSQSRMASGSEEHVAPTQRGTLRARPPAPKTPSSTEGDKQTGAEPADAEETLRMVNAVYSQLNGLEDDPDLAQHKLDDKNERCDFHSCPNRARVSQAYGKFCNRHVIVAPCGFPGCRDKAADQAVMCSKHLKEGKEALYNILTNRPQNVPVCRQFGCFKNDQGRGYCRGHEKLLMATGRLPPHVNKRRLNISNPVQTGGSDLPCRVKTCELDAVRGGLCDTHFRAFQTGSLSVDQLSLDSQQQRRDQELANAAAVAAAAAEAKQASPTASGKLKKYLCKVDKWALLKQSSVFSYCEFLLSFFY
ncbi:hypothetical protein PHYBOEH_004481 [Phytophthora boehmeriae]|uniref:Uncharacterized protein n=1 Tax=Phytophthora boehmeriae TaxID=109152 RepID=A0A8T1WQV0_9STRA|nr:hypothetical protein PHYBOEH_004481 [Phytophthora boehmeriae]